MTTTIDKDKFIDMLDSIDVQLTILSWLDTDVDKDSIKATIDEIREITAEMTAELNKGVE